LETAQAKSFCSFFAGKFSYKTNICQYFPTKSSGLLPAGQTPTDILQLLEAWIRPLQLSKPRIPEHAFYPLWFGFKTELTIKVDNLMCVSTKHLSCVALSLRRK